MELKEVKEFALVMTEKEWLELWYYFWDRRFNYKNNFEYEHKMFDKLEDLRLEKVSKSN